MAKDKGMKTTGTVTQEPYDKTQPALDDIIAQATQNYANGVGTAYPDFSTYAGTGQVTADSLAAIRDYLTNPSAASTAASGAITDILGGNTGFESLLARTGGPTVSETALADLTGAPTTNPYLENYLNIGTENLRNTYRDEYLSRGRYGSGDYIDNLLKGVSDFQTPILYNAYNADQDRRLSAASAIDNSVLGRINAGLSAAGGRASTVLGAISGAGNLGTDRLNAINMLTNAGVYQDQASQAQRDADTARFLWEHGGGDQQALANYLNTILPIAGTGGTATQMEPRTPFKDVLSGIIGLTGAVGTFF